MNRIFVDMDGVTVDFDGLRLEVAEAWDSGIHHPLLTEYRAENPNATECPKLKDLPGAYRVMRPYPMALIAIRSLIGMRYDVFFATKPVTDRPMTYANKYDWVMTHAPELKRKVIMTHDKGTLGDEFDFLIDDRPHKASCHEFKGELIVMTDAHSQWPAIVDHFREIAKERNLRAWNRKQRSFR